MKRFISIFFAHKVLFARKKFFVFMPRCALPYCFSARFMKDLPFLFAMSIACAAPPKSWSTKNTIKSDFSTTYSLRFSIDNLFGTLSSGGYSTSSKGTTSVLYKRYFSSKYGVTNTIFAVLSTSFLNHTAKSYDILSNPP